MRPRLCARQRQQSRGRELSGDARLGLPERPAAVAEISEQAIWTGRLGSLHGMWSRAPRTFEIALPNDGSGRLLIYQRDRCIKPGHWSERDSAKTLMDVPEGVMPGERVALVGGQLKPSRYYPLTKDSDNER